MATYRKRGNNWRVEVRMKGHYLSASYATKAAAREWAIQTEADITLGKLEIKPSSSLKVGDAFRRYGEEVSPTKPGGRWETVRLRAYARNPLANVYLDDLNTTHMVTYRDTRLKQVSPSTVNRDLNLMSAVFTKARKEWKWIETNPIGDLDRPPRSKPRDRRITDDEIERILLSLEYDGYGAITTRGQLVGVLFLLGIETAMRLGEMCSLLSADIHLDKRYAELKNTKNGDRRQVPLSSKAIELCKQLIQSELRVTSANASVIFRDAVKCAEIDNLHFHDTRHEAITRLSQKLDVLALARMVGHRDIQNLMIYYNETATALAERLD